MRIGVNIPNDLMKRLEPLKPQINISQICRDAIAARIEKYETAIVNLEEESTAAALKEAYAKEAEYRSILEVDWEAKGYENAVQWVQCATLKNWNDLHKLRTIRREQGRPEWEAELALFSDERKRIPCFDELCQDHYDNRFAQGDDFWEWLEAQVVDIDWAYARQEYGRSWLAYIDAAWEVICEWRERDRQYLLQEQAASRAARPTPAVPDHLFGDLQYRDQSGFRVTPHNGVLADGVDPLKLNHLIDNPDIETTKTHEEHTG